MNLFNYTQGQLEILPEVENIPEFKAILQKAKTYEEGIKHLLLIWFLCDYRSPCLAFEEVEKQKEARLNSDLPANFKLTSEIQKGIDKYEKYEPIALRLLKSNYTAYNKLIEYFNKIDLVHDVDDKGKPIYSAKDLVANMKQSGDVIAAIKRLEEQVRAEKEDTSLLRGGQVAGENEDGFDDDDDEE